MRRFVTAGLTDRNRRYDADSWLQKFTPRRKNSIWSKINTKHVERLTTAGRMQPAGLREVAAAKADGRWQKAYDSSRNMEMPADFLRELEKNPQAKTFFETLNKTNLYSVAFRLQTAMRAETRDKRMREIIEMLSNGKRFH